MKNQIFLQMGCLAFCALSGRTLELSSAGWPCWRIVRPVGRLSPYPQPSSRYPRTIRRLTANVSAESTHGARGSTLKDWPLRTMKMSYGNLETRFLEDLCRGAAAEDP